MIIPRHEYDQLQRELNTLRQANKDLLITIDLYRKCNQKLENDIRILKNINSDFSDIVFPNTEERGQGDTDTPTNLSDIWFN